ncbi:MAG: carbohydrate-binding family V/XII, partial [bacterium]|nr:carbohydrate-binding family V/XII [bacterium]
MEPPKILVVDHAAVLVSIDGEPVLRAIEDTKMMRVVNTPYTMVFDSASKSYFLNAGVVWYKATAVKGPWQQESKPPAEVAALVPPEALAEAGLESTRSDYQMPRVIVATEPTELVVIEGEPGLTPFPGNELLYVSNTESDLFMEIADQQYYVLMSGRWFRTKSLQGPWSAVLPEQLPASFEAIPAGSDKAHVRVHVAGTSEARDAVMDAQIPQTAAIKRSEAHLDVEYDGQPKFEGVEGTSMQYATNTS